MTNERTDAPPARARNHSAGRPGTALGGSAAWPRRHDACLGLDQRSARRAATLWPARLFGPRTSFAAIAALGALGFFVFLGALAIAIPVVAALVLACLIGGMLRRL
jgi:hypothetical protein